MIVRAIRPVSGRNPLTIKDGWPFLFVLPDTEYGDPLFIGRVSDPSAAP
jgi:hypothetical protein